MSVLTHPGSVEFSWLYKCNLEKSEILNDSLIFHTHTKKDFQKHFRVDIVATNFPGDLNLGIDHTCPLAQNERRQL